MPLVFHPNSLPEECEDEAGEKLKKNTNEMDLTALLLKNEFKSSATCSGRWVPEPSNQGDTDNVIRE